LGLARFVVEAEIRALVGGGVALEVIESFAGALVEQSSTPLAMSLTSRVRKPCKFHDGR
jgi:hypothetical protein